MTNNVHHVLRDATEYIKFPTSSFKLAYERALNALIEDADASTYEPSEANEDAFDFLNAILTDLRDEDADDLDVVVDDDPEDDDDEIEGLDFGKPRHLEILPDDDDDEDII